MKTVLFVNEVAFVSAVKAEELKKIQKFKEESLNLYDEKKEFVEFEYRFREGSGGVAPFGVWFNTVTDEGYAMVKVPVYGENADEKKAYIAETYGSAIVRAGKIEDGLEAVARGIETELEEIKSAVQVVL